MGGGFLNHPGSPLIFVYVGEQLARYLSQGHPGATFDGGAEEEPRGGSGLPEKSAFSSLFLPSRDRPQVELDQELVRPRVRPFHPLRRCISAFNTISPFPFLPPTDIAMDVYLWQFCNEARTCRCRTTEHSEP